MFWNTLWGWCSWPDFTWWLVTSLSWSGLNMEHAWWAARAVRSLMRALCGLKVILLTGNVTCFRRKRVTGFTLRQLRDSPAWRHRKFISLLPAWLGGFSRPNHSVAPTSISLVGQALGFSAPAINKVPIMQDMKRWNNEITNCANILTPIDPSSSFSK